MATNHGHLPHLLSQAPASVNLKSARVSYFTLAARARQQARTDGL